jgi:hypothetical protein
MAVKCTYSIVELRLDLESSRESMDTNHHVLLHVDFTRLKHAILDVDICGSQKGVKAL